MVKTCVGTDFCLFGTQPSITTGIELEKRLENLYTPHKFKLAVVWRRRGQGRAQGRSGDHGSGDTGSDRGCRAVLPVLPGERTTPRTQLAT